MMFEAIPKIRIMMNDTSTVMGSTRAITSALRKCINTKSTITEAMISSSFRIPVSVSIAPWINRVRS